MNTLSSLLKFISYFEPVGSVKMYAGSGTPSKWLYCDGSAVSRTTYAKLFGVIGTTYGAGDGSTTFNVPDFRGRVGVGVGTGTATGATAHTLGQTAGEETVTLTVNQMPKHTHIQNSHNHSQNPHTHTQVAHAHGIPVNLGYHPGNGGAVAGDNAWAVDGTAPGRIGSIGETAVNIQTTATNIGTTAVNQETGNNEAHGNMMPYTAINYIIFAGK